MECLSFSFEYFIAFIVYCYIIHSIHCYIFIAYITTYLLRTLLHISLHLRPQHCYTIHELHKLRYLDVGDDSSTECLDALGREQHNHHDDHNDHEIVVD